MNYDDLEGLVVCSACGTELEAVRPGKHQHPGDTLRLCETIQELQRDALRLDFLDDCVMNRGKCFSADRDYEGQVDLPTHGYLPTITLFTVPSQHVKGIGLRAAIDEAMQHGLPSRV